MAQTPKIVSGNDGDFVLHYESEIVCFDSKKLVAPAGGLVDFDMAGYPVKAGAGDSVELAAAADAGTAVGFLSEKGYLNLEAGEEIEVRVLSRGPAAVNENALPVEDYAGAAIAGGALKTAAENLGLIVRSEPPKVEEQTT
jgi:hypothetical protein